MTTCNCQRYEIPIVSVADIIERCKATPEISPTLERLEWDHEEWMGLYSCKSCGKLWVGEYPFSEDHGGGQICYYRVDTDHATDWMRTARPLLDSIRKEERDRTFFTSLGPETGPELCNENGCVKKRIALSVKCRLHHFQMVVGRPCPFK